MNLSSPTPVSDNTVNMLFLSKALSVTVSINSIKINFYKVDPFDQGIQKMADVIYSAVLAVNSAVSELRNLKNTQKIVECVIRINSAENQADDLFDMSIERLFETEADVKQLIKKREIYQIMEIATDKCEDAGNVIESIVVKYA